MSSRKARKRSSGWDPEENEDRWSVRAKTSRWKQSQPAGQRAFASENYLTSAGSSETWNERLQTWWKLNIYYCKQFWTEIFEFKRWVTFSLFSSNMCHPEMICFDLIQCRRKWSMTNFLTILFLAYAVSSWTISLSPNERRATWIWCKQNFTIRQLTAFPPTFSVQDMYGCNLNICICLDFLYFSHKLIRKSTGKLWVNLLHETRHA